MEFEFNTELEDGSQFEITEVLIHCFQLFSTGRKSELLTYLGHAPIAQVSQCEKSADPNKVQDDSDSSDSDDMDVDDESETSFSYNLRSKCAVKSVTLASDRDLPTVEENSEEMTSEQSSTAISSQADVEVDNDWTVVSGKRRTSKRIQKQSGNC